MRRKAGRQGGGKEEVWDLRDREERIPYVFNAY